MKFRSPALAWMCAVALAGPLGVAAAPATPNFVAADAPAVIAALPAPPAAGSLAALADLEVVLQVQASRTPEEVALAKRIEKDSLFNYADVLGPWFTKANLPVTARFFERVGKDLQAVSERVKVLNSRPRPPAVDPRVHPCVEVPSSYSYPSGHSMRSMMWAYLLAEVVPEKRDELVNWGRRAAWSRVIGGVHFPTDDLGGQLMARAFVDEALKSPEVRAAIARMRAEMQPFLAAPAQAKAA